jgi:nucleotide-binding universal stress UspA family protein
MDTRVAEPIVLVPTDFSQASVGAAKFAADLVRRLRGTLVLLRVLPQREVEEGLDQGKFIDQQMDEGRTYLRWWFTTFVPEEDRRAVRLREFIAIGRPEDEIPVAAEALSATMVIMATHARGGIRRAVLGSVAEAVVRHAPCPVMMLRGPAQAWATATPEPAREPVAAVKAS